jgi:hypothetical protein
MQTSVPTGSYGLAWYNRSTSPEKLRIYYSTDFGATTPTLSHEENLGSTAAHDHGSVSCHATDPDRIAVTVQSAPCNCAAVVITTEGGEPGSWVERTTGGVANTYRTVWSGSRLVLAHDQGGAFRIRISDDDGQTWAQAASFGNASNSEKGIDVIRTSVPGLLFAYIDNSAGADQILRSTLNGDVSSWVPAAALPSGLAGPRAIGYDPQNDYLYVAGNSTSGPVFRLPEARSRNWTTIVATDWEAVPSSGGRPGYRGFTVIKE